MNRKLQLAFQALADAIYLDMLSFDSAKRGLIHLVHEKMEAAGQITKGGSCGGLTLSNMNKFLRQGEREIEELEKRITELDQQRESVWKLLAAFPKPSVFTFEQASSVLQCDATHILNLLIQENECIIERSVGVYQTRKSLYFDISELTSGRRTVSKWAHELMHAARNVPERKNFFLDRTVHLDRKHRDMMELFNPINGRAPHIIISDKAEERSEGERDCRIVTILFYGPSNSLPTGDFAASILADPEDEWKRVRISDISVSRTVCNEFFSTGSNSTEVPSASLIAAETEKKLQAFNSPYASAKPYRFVLTSFEVNAGEAS